MNSQLLKDIKTKAQKKIHDDVFRDAEASKAEIEAVGEVIAKKYGGFISRAPLKSEERAGVKVASDYEGDWHGIKDLARMTLIVPTMNDCRCVLMDIGKEFTAAKKRGVIQIKEVSPDADPCGYSSITVFVRTSNGRAAEIQINMPTIIYAKQSEESVKRSIGDRNYLNIKMKYNLQGGLGHLFYEIYRVKGPDWELAAELSKKYYAFFRSMVPNIAERQALESGVAALRARHPALFTHH